MSGFPTLVGNLLQTAARVPQATAIQDGAATVTYEQLLQQAGTIARELRAQGLQDGERVVLIMQNSAEFAAAYYAVLMAGGVAVLLNAAAKLRDFEAWLANCEASFVLTDADNDEATLAARASVAAARHWRSTGNPRSPFGLTLSAEHAPPRAVDEHAPACILYTSGTTGQPKGVVLSQANLASNAAAIVQYLGLTGDDSIVTVLPFYYSYGSSVLHTHVQVGARLVLEKNLVYPHIVVASIARERATGFAGVPSTFALLLSRVKLADHDLAAMRYVTQAGGAMSPALTQKLREALPGAAVFVMYGQTEATARLTYLPPHMLDRKLGSVGRAIAGVDIEVRGENGAVLDTGGVGSIWVRGPNVMLGYWCNDVATAAVKHDGWLNTGDMGSLDADGYLYLSGRRSDMIKTGAHRVHPQDIEDVIAELPQVQEIAVAGVDDERLGQAIKAFIVPVPGASLSPMQVQAHCRQRLAAYKIPKFVEMVDSLPRTMTGKLRRAELKQRK
ncbi:MAG TPA: class I adenylate-forming enzyme family protein [Povalibacter sp.]|uniref:class I adenylate-forming enzyme family protein n=1 Tax=Povalibacter sp. TaxID=1962978 RepID=UPI002CDE276A|nr:class I adenylate-forming enzyme family protein [Povalibacter sp.]HMN42984.1 class I adenylate-forming enzyme family protein [Povalibacter sp.]